LPLMGRKKTTELLRKLRIAEKLKISVNHYVICVSVVRKLKTIFNLFLVILKGIAGFQSYTTGEISSFEFHEGKSSKFAPRLKRNNTHKI